MELTTDNFAELAAALASRHEEFAAILERHGMPELWRRPSGLNTLVMIILEQQISLSAARSIHRRMSIGLDGISGRKLVLAGEYGLRGFGLTRQKARYCYELGRAVAERRFAPAVLARLSDADAIAALLRLPGIGPWSAAVYLIAALGRVNIWPPGDLALNRAVEDLLPVRQRRKARESGEPWHPYRTVAAQLLWHHYRSASLRSG